MYRAPRNVVATFIQIVTRWRFRKAKFVQSCNTQFLNWLRRFSEQFLPPICALKFVEMLLEGFSYALSIMVVNLNIFNKI
jgi:hypothetical protein